jgi:hypothetical protein
MLSYLWMTAGILASYACFGQEVSVGVIGGAMATDDLTGAGATSVSKRYVVGPTVEIGLPLRLEVEVDALYRREGYQTSFSGQLSTIFADERANSWEFPILLKYRFPSPVARPFLEAGYAPRVIHGSISSNGTDDFAPTGPQYYASRAGTNWPLSHGIVVGGGVRFAIGRLHLSPELRYTRWSNSAISGSYDDGPSWQSTQNQVDVLLGVAWRIR